MASIGRKLDELAVQGRRFTEDWRNVAVAYAAGCLFFIGWWLIIDVAAIYPSQEQFPHPYHVIAIVSSIAFIMIAAPRVRDDYDGGILNSPRYVRLTIFMGFLIGFSCVIAAMWIMFQDYVVHKKHLHSWPGVALFFQNLLIFSSAIAWKLGRRDDDYLEIS